MLTLENRWITLYILKTLNIHRLLVQSGFVSRWCIVYNKDKWHKQESRLCLQTNLLIIIIIVVIIVFLLLLVLFLGCSRWPGVYRTLRTVGNYILRRDQR